MNRVVPFHTGCQLGHGVDVTKFPFQCGKQVPGDVDPIYSTPQLTESQFSFVECRKDVCDVLGIPPEYAVKVMANYIPNPLVLHCLKDVEQNNSLTTTVIFRATFLQQKIYLPDTARESAESKPEGNEENSEETTAKDSMDGSTEKKDFTHIVSAIEAGNELVAILRISSKDNDDPDNFRKISRNLMEVMKASRGVMDDAILLNLETFASKLDEKLNKKNYQDVECTIHYGCYSNQESFQPGVYGMVKAIKGFEEKAVGWTDLLKSGTPTRINADASMLVIKGVKVEKKGIFESLGFGGNKDDSLTSARNYSASFTNSDVDGDPDSFVIFASETDQMYYMRMTLQSNQPEDSDFESLTSVAFSQYPETSNDQFEKLFNILKRLNIAKGRLQRFFDSKRFMSEDREAEGNAILQSINTVYIQVLETVRTLDMIIMPSEEHVDELFRADPIQTVNSFIENVMFKLPPGCDLDLLVIGKTGHGKSSTGNAILGQEKFVTSASSESVTKSTNVAWGNVDGRIIKVVDTPGVCDTNEEQDSIGQAIRAISEAITQCPGGFHALLLVIRFGQRMTNEERKAIGMLKCILGDNVLQTHCVCVVTHGDNFETEMQSKPADQRKTFLQWCKNETGYLKTVFEECGYRCVLFNNKSKDPKVIKGQLIELVAKVDALKDAGTRYTTSLFEFAKQQREKVMSAENVHVSQEMMRDIELVLDNLKRAATNIEEKEKYTKELENLKGMVDNLSNRVTEVEGDQVKLLVETVFSLAEAIHGQIDKIADRPDADSPDSPVEATAVSHDSFRPSDVDLKTQADNLQTIFDEQLVQQEREVNEKIAAEVETKIQEENKCFPAESTVILRNGIKKSLEELVVGEEVLVRAENGDYCFDTVYMFGHRDANTMTEFLVIEVDGYELKVSNCHLVFCVRDGAETCMSAKDIKAGDQVVVFVNNQQQYKSVVQITSKMMRGLFAPFTNSGTVVVDGVLASCYVDVLSHSACHMLLSPVRQMYRISPSLLTYVNGSESGKEIPPWAKHIASWF